MKRILEVCALEGIKVSSETIQKDINLMKKPRPKGFGAPIDFDFKLQEYRYLNPNFTINGIRLTPEESSLLAESFGLIRCVLRTEMGDKLRHALEKVLSISLEEQIARERFPILSTMEPPLSRGYEFMDMLINACRAETVISFVHYSYTKEKFTPIILHPYVIREFDNRWYVYGFSENHQENRSFGLDRIYQPIPLTSYYKKGNLKQVLSFLNDMYGVFPLKTDTSEKVVLIADALSTKFLSAYPIHSSQKIDKSPEGFSEITLNLIPTMELIRLIWSYGNGLIIQYPPWLVEQEIELRML